MSKKYLLNTLSMSLILLLAVTSVCADYWDLDDAEYNQSLNVQAQENTVQDIFLSPNGTFFYVLGNSGDDITEYFLSEAWNISTGTPTGSDLSVGSTPAGFTFKDDGTEVYILDANDIETWDLGTAWDISSATYTSEIDTSSQTANVQKIFIGNSGSKMYLADADVTTSLIYQYSLGTPYDLSTFSYDSKTLDVRGQSIPFVRGIAFDYANGSKMFVAGDEFIVEVSLATAWDISTGSFVKNFSAVAQVGSGHDIKGILFNATGSRLYISEFTDDVTYQYNISGVPPPPPSTDFVLISFPRNSTAYELTNQSYSMIFNFNSSLISNVTNLKFKYNNTNYTITDYSYFTTDDWYNVTINYTDFLIPFITANNTANSVRFYYVIQYLNGTNLSLSQTRQQPIYFSSYLNSVSVNKDYVMESDDFWLYANYTNLSSLATINRTLTYNNTNYTGFSQGLTAPAVDTDTNITYNAWLNVSYNGSFRISNLSYEQRVFAVGFDDCSAFSQVFMNISSIYETNSTAISSDLEAYIWNDYLNTSDIIFTNQTYFEICGSPTWANISVNVDLLYGSTQGLAGRGHYLRNIELINDTYNLTIRNVYSSNSSQLQISVTDAEGESADNRVIVAKKSYLPNNTYFNVDMCSTNDNGICYVTLILDDYYRFDVQNNTDGSLEYQTDKTQITTTEITNGYAITILITGQLDYFYYNDDLTISMEFDNSTNLTAFNVVSNHGFDLTAEMSITKQAFMNDSVIFYQSQTGSNIVVWAKINDTDQSNYVVEYNVTWVNNGGYELQFTPLNISFGERLARSGEFIFAALLMVLFFALMREGSVWTIILGLVGLILAVLLNLIDASGIAGTWLMGIVVVGIILIGWVRRR